MDAKKRQFGKQQDFWENAKLALGNDWFWWWVPTHPELELNYYERVWPAKTVRLLRRSGLLSQQVEETDDDKKVILAERDKSHFEKKLIVVTIIILELLWVVKLFIDAT